MVAPMMRTKIKERENCLKTLDLINSNKDCRIVSYRYNISCDALDLF